MRHSISQQPGDVMETSLSHLIHAPLKHTEKIDKQQKNSGADIAALATNFKQTADALGGKVQAAQVLSTPRKERAPTTQR